MTDDKRKIAGEETVDAIIAKARQMGEPSGSLIPGLVDYIAELEAELSKSQTENAELKKKKSRWTELKETTNSGKRLFQCKVCGRKTPTPDKDCVTFADPAESMLCSRYEGSFIIIQLLQALKEKAEKNFDKVNDEILKLHADLDARIEYEAEWDKRIHDAGIPTNPTGDGAQEE